MSAPVSRDLPVAPGPAAALPTAFEAVPDLVGARIARRLAVFLDYDGTLTPIVATPDLAVLDDDARDVVQRLSETVPTAVVSGRDLDDLLERVGIPGLTYVGSHGFQVQHPDGGRTTVPGAESFLPVLAEAADRLDARLAPVEGARLERKRFALAAHFRQVPELRVADVREAVMEVAAAVDGLRVSGGKEVLELRPDLDWHKGRSVRRLFQEIADRTGADLPVYVGDDLTDEDAFREVMADGLGVVVGEPSITWARMRLEDVAEVVRWLAAIADGGGAR